jgi:hypothetical protein
MSFLLHFSSEPTSEFFPNTPESPTRTVNVGESYETEQFGNIICKVWEAEKRLKSCPTTCISTRHKVPEMVNSFSLDGWAVLNSEWMTLLLCSKTKLNCTGFTGKGSVIYL